MLKYLTDFPESRRYFESNVCWNDPKKYPNGIKKPTVDTEKFVLKLGCAFCDKLKKIFLS